MVKTLIITKEELKIVELFKNNLFGEYTIREIMKKLIRNLIIGFLEQLIS